MKIDKKYFIPLLLFTVSALYWGYQVFKSGDADGFDGYYYVMQIHTLLENGSMHSKDFSLIYLPLILFSKILTPIISYKLTVTLIGTGLSLSAFLFVKKRSNSIMGLLALAFTLVSPSVLFFLLQFPKNALGCVILLLFLTKYRKRNYLATIIVLILLLFSHRLTFVIGFCYLLGDVILKRVNKKIILAAVVLSIIALNIPGLLNIFDYKRVIFNNLKLFSYWGQTEFLNLWNLWNNPSWLFDTLFIHSMIVLAIIRIKKEPILTSLLLFLLLPIWEYSSGSLSYRLYLNGYLLLPILSLALFNEKREIKVSCLLLFISFILAFSPRYIHKRFNPPINLYRSISYSVKEKLLDEEADIIIAHKGIKEQIILNTRFDASNWKPKKSSDKTYRIFTNIPDYFILNYMDSSKISDIIPLPGGYYLIKETYFQDFIEKIKDNQELYRSMDSWQNPLSSKPSFL